jgi:hypothetical protein
MLFYQWPEVLLHAQVMSLRHETTLFLRIFDLVAAVNACQGRIAKILLLHSEDTRFSFILDLPRIHCLPDLRMLASQFSS